jgi:hypothetical protein
MPVPDNHGPDAGAGAKRDLALKWEEQLGTLLKLLQLRSLAAYALKAAVPITPEVLMEASR